MLWGAAMMLVLRDKTSGGRVYLRLCTGLVIGALGSDPARYLGLTEKAARHLARYGRAP